MKSIFRYSTEPVLTQKPTLQISPLGCDWIVIMDKSSNDVKSCDNEVYVKPSLLVEKL